MSLGGQLAAITPGQGLGASGQGIGCTLKKMGMLLT